MDLRSHSIRHFVAGFAFILVGCGGSSTPSQPTPAVTVASITVGVAGNATAVVGNSTPDARAANIVVSIQDGPNTMHAVQQDRPAGCSYVVWPEHIDFPNSGGSGAFDVVTTPGDCQWTVAAGAVLRIVLTGRTGGIGNGRVTYRVDPNPYATDTTDQIQIRGLSGLNPPGIHTLTVAKK